MKLTRIHVENFGSLQNFDLSPLPGLNRLEHPNGWGKTTLVAFLKAMLFGLPSARGKEENNERKKYAPWQGGVFGGRIELSSSLGNFRIERRFGARPQQDFLSVTDLDTGRITERLGENPGETLFGVNAEGFERSALYTRRELSDDKAAGASITARLNSLLDNVEDAGSFDLALDRIKDAKNDLEKPRGGVKLAALESLLFETRKTIETLEEKKEDLKKAEEELAACNDALASLEKAEEEFRSRREKVSLLTRKKKLDEEILRLTSAVSGLEAVFCGHPLTKEELKEQSNRYDELQNALARADALEEAFAKAEYERLAKDFEEGIDKQALSKAEEIAAKRKSLQERLASLPQSKAEPSKFGVLLPLSLLLMVLGIGLVIPLLLGKSLLFLAGALPAFAAGCALFSFALLRSEKSKRAQKRCEEESVELAKQIGKLDLDFGDALPIYRGQAADEMLCRTLRENAGRFAALREEKERLDKARAQAAQWSGTLERFLSLYETETDQKDPRATLARLDSALQQLDWNRALLAQKEAELKEVAAPLGSLSKTDEALPQEPEIDWKEKRAEWESKRRILERQVETLAADIDKIPELSDYLASAESDLSHRKEKIKILEQTENYLKTAKDALSTRYRAGIESRLPTFLARVGGGKIPESSVDPELQVYYYAGGKSRPLSAFSQGERDLTDFCLRLALTEALTAGGDAPFLLLDDPFVNLDDERFAAAKELLSDLEREYQIFYLVCRREE